MSTPNDPWIEPGELSAGDTVRLQDGEGNRLQGRLASKPYPLDRLRNLWIFRLDGGRLITTDLPVEKLPAESQV